jgi:site-specific DNA-methyltransferase (adenine-specific)
VTDLTPSAPYYADDQITLYLGDCRELIPELGLTADLVVADPPYGETSLKWDRWPGGWVEVAATVARSMWCFGSMRMFGEHWREFRSATWKLSQDIVWEKNAGTGIFTDRFKRVHENALHWYCGARWADIYKDAQRVPAAPIGTPGRSRTVPGEAVKGADGRRRGEHLGDLHRKTTWVDDDTRLQVSILRAKNLRGLAIHPTEKPVNLLTPLIKYACPGGGLLLDPFAGSGSTLDAARLSGRRAVGIEVDERYAERAAKRLAQGVIGADRD